ncbi:MAG: 7-cyano-7-deazaguanine synthase QueC [Candidatus Tantalella remota]|nr:7-cyano-7-deazaguanine synthase QueC [Candidatus Tantalella remota]
MNKAIVLLSGGMDSAVTLFMAMKEYECHALIFNYGQKALKEVDMAARVSEKAKVPFTMLNISMPWEGSALLDETIAVPEKGASTSGSIPSTYVPARNIIFLSYGVSYAEAIGAETVFIGAHQMDFSNYPDCRGEFFEAFQEMVRRGTKQGVEGNGVKIATPVLNMAKKDILSEGLRLGVPFEDTWSCYTGDEDPCGKCESCHFREEAFAAAGIDDPLISKKSGSAFAKAMADK